MASVVDTSVKHFHSAMTGAPVLSGTAGSLIALLNACLVTGFDVRAGTSLTVAAGVATLSFSGVHSAAVDTVITVSGASIAALNGEQKVTSILPGLVRFATAAADGTATGTLSFKISGAGWSSPFTSATIAAYKSLDPLSTGMILRVDDSAALQARVVGYETMSDINTGTGPFPTPLQISGGGLWAKSVTTGAAAVPWSIFSDGRRFYFGSAFLASSSATYFGQVLRGFGDLTAHRPGGDSYACGLNCHFNTTAAPAAAAALCSYAGDGTAAQGGTVLVRNFSGLPGTSEINQPYAYFGTAGGFSGLDTRFGDYPSLFSELMVSAKHVALSNTAAVRADVPGLYHVPHGKMLDTLKTGDLLPGTGVLAGRSLRAVSASQSNSGTSNLQIGVVLFDITGPWRN